MASLIFDADVRTARLVAEGRACVACGTTFVESHGIAVACHFCWRRLPVKWKGKVTRATHDEETVKTHKAIARAQREKKSKWAGFSIAPRTTQESE